MNPFILIFGGWRGKADQAGCVGFACGEALVDEAITTIPHPPRGFDAPVRTPYRGRSKPASQKGRRLLEYSRFLQKVTWLSARS